MLAESQPIPYFSRVRHTYVLMNSLRILSSPLTEVYISLLGLHDPLKFITIPLRSVHYNSQVLINKL